MVSFVTEVRRLKHIKVAQNMSNIQICQFLEKTAVVSQDDEPKSNAILTDNALSIVEYLGGIEQVICLCLTHPDSNEVYSQQVMSSINALITNDTINEPKMQQTPIFNQKPPNLNDANIDENSQVAITIVNNRKEYDKSRIVINAHPSDNLCFRWLNHAIANRIMNLIIFNTHYIIKATIVSVLITFILIPVYEYWSESIRVNIYVVTVYAIFQCVVILFSLIYGIIIILTLNLTLFRIICKTFDFWFKVWNLFLWLNDNTISSSEDGHIADFIFKKIVVLILFGTLFCLDAIPIKYHFKRMLLIIYLCRFIPYVITQYFVYDDISYNPLQKYNFKHTSISIKGVYLGSYVNLVVFVAKPVVVDLIKWLKQKLTVKSNNKQLQDRDINT